MGMRTEPNRRRLRHWSQRAVARLVRDPRWRVGTVGATVDLILTVYSAAQADTTLGWLPWRSLRASTVAGPVLGGARLPWAWKWRAG